LRIDLSTHDLGSHAVHTGEPLRLSATETATGDPAQVQWRITASNNAPALGQGSISPDGLYTPPAMLSRDVVTVLISAQPATNEPPVTTTLSVVPGFVQPLQPENATIAPGSTLSVRAQLAEVGSGSVLWRLEGAANDSPAAIEASALGSLGAQHCVRDPKQFTSCTVTYTAPPTPLSGTVVWLVASTRGVVGQPGVSIRARLVPGSLTSNPALHQAEQAGPVALGGSGGSDNDFDTYKDATGARYVADCCGGTLGGLVEDQSGTPYILSNNHVLATSDQGRPGDTIEQPGLIDDGCVPLSHAGARVEPVGTLRYLVPLNSRSSNVDAALASVRPGTVDPSGLILELGTVTPQNGLRSAPPVAGLGEALDAGILSSLSVVKSGRTTGLTCSSVEAIDLQVTVDYYEDCAETQPYTTKTFTGQIGIGGEAFADSGDSGALVLDAANARAIGLLYATGTTGGPAPSGLTLANPIGDVLAELGAQTGSPLSLRGTSTPHRVECLDYDAPPARPALSSLTADERARVASAVEAAGALRSSRVLAVAGGASADEPGKGAVIVYLDRTQPPPTVPGTIAGVRTVIVPTDAETIAEAIARGPGSWPSAPVSRGLRLAPAVLAAGRAAAARLAPLMMQTPAIFGVGVAQSLDDGDQAALLVLLDSDASQLEAERVLAQLAAPGDAVPGQLPAMLGGLRVRYLVMHRLRVTESKYIARGVPSSCSLRPVSRAARSPNVDVQQPLLGSSQANPTRPRD
jgi:hypothetical protein